MSAGILINKQIGELVDQGAILFGKPLAEDQIQPASLDLRLGEKVWRMKSSFLLKEGGGVEDKLADMAMHAISLEDGAVLEKGCVYMAKLEEHLALPDSIGGVANPKSSTGRLDVFTRLVTDGATEFDTVGRGYKGPLYAEISPQTFSILVRRGSRLSQLRLRQGEAHLEKSDIKQIQDATKLAYDIQKGIPLSIDLSGQVHSAIPSLIGWRARKHAGLIDIDKAQNYPTESFWEQVTTRDLSGAGLILNPDEFYILSSKEDVVVPPSYAAEMSAIDTRLGEFRAHYAGFFDPGFGFDAPSRAVLEMRSHNIPFLIEEGQTVCHLLYEHLAAEPSQLYGTKSFSSNYQGQSLKLAKHFLPPEDESNG